MLSLKLVRSLVLGETINNHPLVFAKSQSYNNRSTDSDGKQDQKARCEDMTRDQFLLFLPTKELVTDTYRLASIARDIGMDLHPTPSLSHIIFSYPNLSSSSASSSSTPSSSSHLPPLSSFSSISLSSSLSLPDDVVPLPFPFLSTASLTHLRSFVRLSKGLFKLVSISSKLDFKEGGESGDISNWDCCSFSLYSQLNGGRIDDMDDFSRALIGKGWTLFRIWQKQNPKPNSRDKLVYLFRKIEKNRVLWAKRMSGDGGSASGDCRIRELRLPTLDFRNAPLRILQYILLMTDDNFYIA